MRTTSALLVTTCAGALLACAGIGSSEALEIIPQGGTVTTTSTMTPSLPVQPALDSFEAPPQRVAVMNAVASDGTPIPTGGHEADGVIYDASGRVWGCVGGGNWCASAPSQTPEERLEPVSPTQDARAKTPAQGRRCGAGAKPTCVGDSIAECLNGVWQLTPCDPYGCRPSPIGYLDEDSCAAD